MNEKSEKAASGIGSSVTSTLYRISIGFKDDSGVCHDYMDAGSDLKHAVAIARVLAGNPAIEVVALFENEVTVTRKRLAWFSPVESSDYALAADQETAASDGEKPQDIPVSGA